MINSISFSSLMAWQPKSTAKPGQPSVTDPAAQERIDRAKSALSAMKEATEAQRNSMKSNAQEKLQRIKEQIRILRQFGGDPKVIAREVARLARELSGAVKQYTDAARGGGANGSDNAEPAAEESKDASAEVTAAEGTPEAAEAEAEAEAEAKASLKADAEQPGTSTADKAKADSSFREEALRLFAKLEQHSGMSKADADFFALARNLLQQLKALIAAQQEKARRGDPEAQEAVKAVSEAGDTIIDSVGAMQSVDLQV